MAVGHQVLSGEVMHARLAPKKNRFSYKTFNIAINLSQLDTPYRYQLGR